MRDQNAGFPSEGEQKRCPVTITALSPEQSAQVAKVADLLRSHRTFLVVGHLRPDADCIGSQTGLALGLRKLGKQARLYNRGPIPRSLLATPHLGEVESELDPSFIPDCTVVVDCGGIDRVSDDFRPQGAVVNIDHHAANDFFGDAHYVNTDATAAAEMVFDVLRELGVGLDTEIASALYLGLMGDCGSFRFANTTRRTFEVATALVSAGADPSEIAAVFYDTASRGSLWLKGQVFSSLHFECDDRVCWVEIDAAMYREAGGEEHEPEGLVSEIRAIEGIEVAALIHEVEGVGSRASFRSKGNIDVNIIARALGGGGHRNASGCFMRGDHAELRDRIVSTLRDHVRQAAAV
jgi:phosphoesterase RecJ-like protein